MLKAEADADLARSILIADWIHYQSQHQVILQHQWQQLQEKLMQENGGALEQALSATPPTTGRKRERRSTSTSTAPAKSTPAATEPTQTTTATSVAATVAATGAWTIESEKASTSSTKLRIVLKRPAPKDF